MSAKHGHFAGASREKRATLASPMAKPVPIQTAVEAHDVLGESCRWCPITHRLWWLDILKPCLQSFDPASGEHRIYPLPGRNCGCVVPRRGGGFVLAMDSGLHGFDPDAGRLEHLLHIEAEKPNNRYNDGCCDRAGRLWIGTMDCQPRHPSGSFYRIGPDRSVLRLFDGITVPNSTAFSPDDRTLYFADTPRRLIWMFDFDLAAGTVANRRPFADLSGRKALPDGSCVDADGFLWNAEYAGSRLTRYAPDGRVDRFIELPVINPTSCCFGGADFATLYVTSAAYRLATPAAIEGALLALDPGVRGLPEAAYAG
jgi:sugar lactone lactonase YvrE